MSLSGLNSGLYQQFYHYAELTDKALIELKEEAPGVQENRQKLGNFLTELRETKGRDISARLMWNLLINEMNLNEKQIQELGESLVQIKVQTQEKIISLLERLALVLAEEQAVVKSRLRRGVR